MKTKLEQERMQSLAAAFPHTGWQQLDTYHFFSASSPKSAANWKSIAHLKNTGGVYVILLPSSWFEPCRTIGLHASHRYEGKQIEFEFRVQPFLPDGYGIVYVGRTSDLEDRWRGHFSRGERKNGGQVKFGLMDCGLHSDPDEALRILRAHARIIYTVLPGIENCANRDLLEMSLCARFAPPFNIKAER